MSTATQPLFDMSKAQPISAPLFDMSKAQPIQTGAQNPTQVQQADQPSWWDKLKSMLTTAPHAPTAQEAQGFAKELGSQTDVTQSPAAQAARDIRAGNYAEAIHRTATAVGQAEAPMIIPAAATAPLATGIALASGMGGQYLAKKGATALGATPAQANVAGDVGAIGAGMAGGALSESASNMVSGSDLVSKFSRKVPLSKVDVPSPSGEMQPALAATPRDVLNYAQSKGINLTPGQGAGTAAAKTIEAVGERSLLGAEQLDDAKNLNAMRLAANIKNIADASDPKGMGLSEEQAGETIQQTAKVAQAVAHENASNAYNLPQDLLDEPISTSAIRTKYAQKLSNAQVSLANRDPNMAAQVAGAYQRGANLGTPGMNFDGEPVMRPELTFGDMMKVRSDAIKDGTALVRAGAPSEVQGIYNGLSHDIDSAMAQTAQSKGYTDEWRGANALWKDYMSKYNDTQSPIYRILNQRDPAMVTRNILNRGSAADIDLLKQENMQPALEALKRQTIVDIANRGFRVNADGLGGYSDSFLNTLFGRSKTQELYLNGALARRFNFQLNPSGTSNVLLGEGQLHPGTPTKWMVPLGAARASMPQPATSYLPSPVSRPTVGLAALSGLVGGNRNQ